jgi:hypothetical protein
VAAHPVGIARPPASRRLAVAVGRLRRHLVVGRAVRSRVAGGPIPAPHGLLGLLWLLWLLVGHGLGLLGLRLGLGLLARADAPGLLLVELPELVDLLVVVIPPAVGLLQARLNASRSTTSASPVATMVRRCALTARRLISGSRSFQSARIGAAMAIDEMPPARMPMISARAKSLSVSPPKMKSTTSGSSVVIEVMIDRFSTSWTEVLTISR